MYERHCKKATVREREPLPKRHAMKRIPASENQNVEFKESWNDDVLKWVCAFANAQGGDLWIGVRDDGIPIGVRNARKLQEDIPNKIVSAMGLICPVSTVVYDGKQILKIEVRPSAAPVSYHGEFHVRSGATKQRLEGNALTQFLLGKSGLKWDGIPVDGVSVEDLDYESFEIFKSHAVASGRMSRNDIDIKRCELLDKLGLVTNGRLSRAAVLLFHRTPEKFFPGCLTKIGKFLTTSELSFQDEINGSLMIQAVRAIDLLYLKYLVAPVSYNDITRIERYPYPKDAVRELLFNALMHQDFLLGGSVQISVHPDCLYISNAGGLPPTWTVETLFGKHRSQARNGLVAATFYRAGFVEQWGRGIEKVRAICRESGNPDPVFFVTGSDVMVKMASTPVAAPVTVPVTAPVTAPVAAPGGELVPETPLWRLVSSIGKEELTAAEIRDTLALSHRNYVRDAYLTPALRLGYIEYTIPDKPHSRFQKYRLTAKGRAALDAKRRIR